MICRRWLGARVVKVSHQQSKRVKCLSCLFTVNDDFDSSPKEQWETRSEGSALGRMGDIAAGSKCCVLCFSLNGNFSCQHVYVCVHVLLEAAESLWSVQSEQYIRDFIFHPPFPASHLSTHPPSTAQAQWSCWWLLRYGGTVALPFVTTLPLWIYRLAHWTGVRFRSISYHSFTFECIGLRTDFCLATL